MADPRPVPAAIRAAARLGLPVDVWHAEIEPDVASDVLARARFDRMTGFLAAAVLEGPVEADDEISETLVAAWQDELAAVVLIEAYAVRTAAVLDDAGVRWRLTKGAALAHLDYRDLLAMRTFGDVDIVIHPEDWDRTLDAMRESDFRRPSPELRAGYDRRFGKGATMIDAREWEIDLHRRFAIGRFGVRSRMEELFERADSITLAGRSIPVLAGPDRLLHACHHLVLGGFSGLRVARDVAQLLLVSRVDWEDTVRTAERWRVDAVVASGIVQAWQRLEIEIAHPAQQWAAGHEIDRRDAKAIAVFTAERPFREQALTAVPRSRGTRCRRTSSRSAFPAANRSDIAFGGPSNAFGAERWRSSVERRDVRSPSRRATASCSIGAPGSVSLNQPTRKRTWSSRSP